MGTYISILTVLFANWLVALQIVDHSKRFFVCMCMYSGPTAMLPDSRPVPVDCALLPESFHPGYSPTGQCLSVIRELPSWRLATRSVSAIRQRPSWLLTTRSVSVCNQLTPSWWLATRSVFAIRLRQSWLLATRSVSVCYQSASIPALHYQARLVSAIRELPYWLFTISQCLFIGEFSSWILATR